MDFNNNDNNPSVDGTQGKAEPVQSQSSAWNDDTQREVIPVKPEPTTWDAGASSVVPPVRQPKNWSFLKSYAYLPEYAVMLFVLYLLLMAIVSLFGIGVENLAVTESTVADTYSPYTGGWDTLQLVWWLATVIVTMPVTTLLFIRTKNSEKSNPEIKEHRWRKGFLATFLVFEILAVVCAVMGLAFNLIARVVNIGGVFSSISDSINNTPVWVTILTSLFAVTVYGFAIFVMSRDYKKGDK